MGVRTDHECINDFTSRRIRIKSCEIGQGANSRVKLKEVAKPFLVAPFPFKVGCEYANEDPSSLSTIVRDRLGMNGFIGSMNVLFDFERQLALPRHGFQSIRGGKRDEKRMLQVQGHEGYDSHNGCCEDRSHMDNTPNNHHPERS
jgi:hypothetical protein